jgi:hypothetical protein
MTERTLIDRVLDAGAATDWITPTYEALRNLMQNGKSFTVTQEEWELLQPLLEQRRISHWGVAIHGTDEWGQYVFTFSVRAEDAETIDRLLGVRPGGGRFKALLMLAFVLLVLFGTAAMVAVVATLGEGG